jgi:hypothetical protein
MDRNRTTSPTPSATPTRAGHPQRGASTSRRFIEIAANVGDLSDAISTLAGRFLEDISCLPTDVEALCRRLEIVEIIPEDIPFSGELGPSGSGFATIYGPALIDGSESPRGLHTAEVSASIDLSLMPANL